MLASLIAAAAIAATQPKTPPEPPRPKEPSVAELKTANGQLQAQVVYLSGLVNALKAEREQSSDQAADLSARMQAQGRPK